MSRIYSKKDNDIYSHYTTLRTKQNLEHVDYMLEKYCSPSALTIKMDLWDVFDKLNTVFVDKSDPDLPGISNDYHAIQTAEGIRNNNGPEWMQLVGLLHDLGKIIYIKGCDEDGTTVNNQWSIGGDTFIVGCEIPSSTVFPELNALNIINQSSNNTKCGIYDQNCGLDSCKASFGHDEYMYRVLMNMLNNHCNDKNEFNNGETYEYLRMILYVIRWHSLYPWHTHESYSHLTNNTDRKMLPYLKEFCKYDLYTKSNEKYELNKDTKQYYTNLMLKYFGTTILFF